MASLTDRVQLDKPQRAAIYARVSTEDQAERQTVQSQLDFLRRFCDLHQLPVADEYVDDGASGAIPLAKRTEGRRLLDDAAAGRFTEVLVYRLDRLGRSVRALLESDAELERVGVTIHSATEPFDTATPIGRFVFQLLGSIAELERATITERTMMGRARAIREGRWTQGPVPFGYGAGEERRLVASDHVLPGLGLTEADMVRELFEHVANGSTLLGEARRLNALGVPVISRSAGRRASREWRVGRIYDIIANPLYRGEFVLETKRGERVTGSVPALVSPELWAAANAHMSRNKKLAMRNAKERYLLRGLIRCWCGMGYSGLRDARRNPPWRYYRCNGQVTSNRPNPADRCSAPLLPADRLEELVWQDIHAFLMDPGDALEEARRKLQERLAATRTSHDHRDRLRAQLAEKESDRERVIILYRRGQLELEETERQLEAIGAERRSIEEMLAALEAEAELERAQVQQFEDARRLAETLREGLAQIDAENDWDAKRQLVELLVDRIRIERRSDGEGRAATMVTIEYAFAQPKIAAMSQDGSIVDSGEW